MQRPHARDWAAPAAVMMPAREILFLLACGMKSKSIPSSGETGTMAPSFPPDYKSGMPRCPPSGIW